MKNWILRWIASIVALLVIVEVYQAIGSRPDHHPGIWVESPMAILIAVVALGLANSVVRPIIMIFAWPINCLTFGLFSFVLNVLLFLIVGNLGFGFHVNGAFDALVGSVAMGAIGGLINFMLKDKGEKSRSPRD